MKIIDVTLNAHTPLSELVYFLQVIIRISAEHATTASKSSRYKFITEIDPDRND
jgi:hypothetical protein